MSKLKNIIGVGLIGALVFGCGKEQPASTSTSESYECNDDYADGTYPCQNVDLLAHVPVKDLPGDSLRLNDIWGWTDPSTGNEYALVGLTDGVAFVDVTSPTEPKIVGKLEETSMTSKTQRSAFHDDYEKKSAWRDFKVYNNHLFVVSDAQPHGMQVFDLSRLREVDDPPKMFTEDYLYDAFSNAHNIAINTETGFAYVVGSDTYGGGLHIIDISTPLSPKFVGSHSDSTVGRNKTGYVHDTQCVIYEGPDEDYQGDELCFNSSETHLMVANVTNKDSTYTMSVVSYEGNEYAHQGWLTEDQRYFLLNDELDELENGHKTRTYIWDVQDLNDPQLIAKHDSPENSIGHNLYVKEDYVFQTNYTSGLRILSLENITQGELKEVAYFDTYLIHNRKEFDGAWSNYPYFSSGTIIVSDISNGLFVLRPNL